MLKGVKNMVRKLYLIKLWKNIQNKSKKISFTKLFQTCFYED